MCGRYTLAEDGPYHFQERFGVADFHETHIQPRFNVAPGQRVLAIVERPDGRRLEEMHWGYLPAWARKNPKMAPQINARSETVAEKAFYRSALQKHRCLIPADGFYEWRSRPGTPKQPMHIRLRDGSLFAFAGLYEPGDADHEASCAIVTTAANAVMAEIHQRMPVILEREDEATWLDAAVTDPIALLGCLRQYPAELMEAYVVGPDVGSVRNDGRELTQPADEATAPQRLF